MSAHPRGRLDVSGLPKTTWDAKNLNWWGTVGFIGIEGATLAVAAGCYLYLRRNFPEWPPPTTPLPDVVLPTIGMLVLLLVTVPMALVDRAARRRDLPKVRLWLVVAVALSAVVAVIRWFELTRALQVRWDGSAYGSAAWLVVVAHSTLVATDLLETGAIAGLSFSGRWRDKHYSDASDAALYQYYLSLAWVPLYLLVFWGPRWL